MDELRELHLLGALGAVRTEMWDGREHLVVPVVALMEGVIHAVNAKTAEYVPGSSLLSSVNRWNGHPLVIGHPVKDGRQISAHDPAVLAKHGCGFIRQAHMNGNRLGMEALVDPARMEALGHSQLLADLRAGKGCEVSVGAFVNTNSVGGVHGGKTYDGEWTEINPDHLAMLPGGTGACSIAMGCGMHRSAQAYLVTAEGFELQEEKRPMPKTLKDIKARILALFDTPEQAASEEAAELVAYNTLKTMAEACGASCDQIMSTIDELIADEDETPTETPAQEDAEEEVEQARLQSINMLCMTMMSGCGAMMQQVNSLLAPDMPEMSDPRYAEAFRAAIGKAISAANMKTVQAAHDSSHDMHSSTVALGAECSGMKVLASKTCGMCDGTGQIKTGDKQSDCTACDGAGVLTVAAATGDSQLKAACGCVGDENMTSQERTAALKALTELKDANFTADESKGIAMLSDKCIGTLTVLAGRSPADGIIQAKAAADAALAGHAHGLNAQDLAAQKKEEAAKGEPKAAAAKTPEQEQAEFYMKNPEIKVLVERQKQQDADEKAALVTVLSASKIRTAEQLSTKTIDELKELAAFAKIDAPKNDFSGRGIPVQRSASTEDFTPPDPYEKGIKALQSVN